MAGKSQLDSSKAYLIRGDTLAKMQDRDEALWNGDNIQRGPGILRRGSGKAGFSLAAKRGNQNVPSTGAVLHALTVYDASAGGANGLIGVTPGIVTDLTNSGTVWTPMLNGVLINNPITPKSAPLDPAATCAYLNASVDSSTGFITAVEIDTDSGGGKPTSTDSNWYELLTTLVVTIISGKASVKCNNDGAQSNLFFAICGSAPLTDGTQYRVGT